MQESDPSFWIALGFLALIHLIGIFDFLAVYGIIHFHSISHYVQQWSLQSAALPFAVGFIAGHLFFGRAV